MKVPAWRVAMANVVDGSVALVPLCAIVIWWLGAIVAGFEAGFGGLLLYGAPAAVFTAPCVWWAMSVWRARTGADRRRTIGLFVAGLQVLDGAVARVDLRGESVHTRALRAGAAAIAVVAVGAFAYALLVIGAAGVGIVRGWVAPESVGAGIECVPQTASSQGER